jgi:hypothetical protein
MASNSYTFIIVPDAKSQCKRYVIPNFVFYILGVTGVVLLVVLSILIHTMLGEYRAVSKKMAQLQKLKKVSLSQKSSIDRYEEDIVQLSKNLSHIKQLNSRLMILTGLDPERGENNLGLGGPEDGSSKVKDQDSEKDGQKE